MGYSLRNGIKEYEQERNAPAKIFPDGTKARAVFTLGEAFEKNYDADCLGLDFDKATQVINFRADIQVGEEQAVIYPKIALPADQQDPGFNLKKAQRGKAMLAALACNKFGIDSDDSAKLDFDTFNAMLASLNEVTCTVELGVYTGKKAGDQPRQYIKEIFLPPERPKQAPPPQPMPQQMPQQQPWGANTAPQFAPPAGSPQAMQQMPPQMATWPGQNPIWQQQMQAMPQQQQQQNGWPVPSNEPDDIPF